MRDLFKSAGAKFIGLGGIHCQCCDSKMSTKRKSKRTKHLFSRIRRSILKRNTIKEIRDETN